MVQFFLESFTLADQGFYGWKFIGISRRLVLVSLLSFITLVLIVN